ncbi:hypothetical protein [Deinococcus actinosclerus]|uniref:Alpha/beta hydrolase n=1 Tax=Deinococcus actinosclerus TaxID=1768108 RepID=A0ABM5X350_9DEIO|nr:hypothetical protein [Deinococcus actinosclerus]ALW87905.1 hypothetical protein AUC44_02480 [Deinococcus actinosclerus]
MTSETVTADVRGFRGEALPCVVNRHPPGEAVGAALLLPGLGYGARQPGLLYPALLLDELGFDTLALDTRWNVPAFMDAPQEEQLAWLREDVRAAYHAILPGRGGACVVAKSIGTLGLTLLLHGGAVPPGARLVWLTPLLERPEVRAAIAAHAATSLVVIGTQDGHYRPEWITELTGAGVQVLVLDGVNHGLQVEGDVVGTLGALHALMRDLRAFLTGQAGKGAAR